MRSFLFVYFYIFEGLMVKSVGEEIKILGFRGGFRMISEWVRFDHITVLYVFGQNA